MPRPNTGRVPVTVKLSPDGLHRIDERATSNGVDRSEMIRRMLKYADRRMPKTAGDEATRDR